MSSGSSPEQQTMRKRLARWREFFFAQKYRFDLGQSFLVIVNFTLLIIAASDKLQIFFGARLRSLLIVIVPLGFIGVWFFGYFMDRIVRAAQMSERQSVKRSEVWAHHNAQMDRIEQELKELKEMLKKDGDV